MPEDADISVPDADMCVPADRARAQARAAKNGDNSKKDGEQRCTLLPLSPARLPASGGRALTARLQSGLTPQQRKERDAAALAEKIAKKKAADGTA